MDWDRKLVSKDLLLYLREQLMAALETRDKADARFNEIGMITKFLTDAIWNKQDISEIADVIEDMYNAVYYSHLEMWSKCDEFCLYFSIEKIESIYADNL